jgi:chemotaxis protein CheD
MQAKIFGGAQVMANFTTMNVGERNTSFVTEYLQTERIPIVSEDVLDIYPRKVVFFIHGQGHGQAPGTRPS